MKTRSIIITLLFFLLYIRQNEKCAFYKTKGAIKSQKQQTPITKVCCFFLMLEQRSNIIQKALKKVKIY